MTSFQRWLMAALALSCLFLSFYSYTINRNLQVVESRQRGQIFTTGQSLWFSWYNCVEELNFTLSASDQHNQANVMNYLANAQLYCRLSTYFIYNYNAALDWPIKPWWNLGLSSGNVIGFVRLFDYYAVEINHVSSTIKEEGSVSAASRARIQQLHDDMKTFAKQLPQVMLEHGDISQIHQAIATWCGMITDVDAKEAIHLREEQYQDVCK